MRLTLEEKTAGRRFRDDAQSELSRLCEKKPADIEAPNFLAVVRHLCPSRNNRSTAIELKEVYVKSGSYVVGGGEDALHAWSPLDTNIPNDFMAGGPDSLVRVPQGRFGFIYREGQCRGCGQTARSKAGRLVDGWSRPPIQGRVARSA